MRRLTQEEFILRAREIHGDKYEYDKAEYKNMKTKVLIYCKACQKYCEDHNITLIEIPYTEINNIESILKEELKIK